MSAPAPLPHPVFYQLSEFAHFIDVGVGINLAYTILEQIYSTSHKAYSDKLDSILRQCSALTEPGSKNDHWNSYQEKMQKKKFESRKKRTVIYVRIVRIWALIAAILLTIILGKIGFDPNYEISQAGVWIGICLLIIPVPLIGLIIIILWQVWLSNLKSELNRHKLIILEDQNTALTSLESSLDKLK